MKRSPEFEELLLSMAPDLNRFALYLTRDVNDAQDLVQETMLQAIDCVDRCTEDSNTKAWVKAILFNQYRRLKQHYWREVEDPHDRESAKLEFLPRQEADHDRRKLFEALGLLPTAERDAVLMIEVADYSYDEVSARMGISKRTVRRRVESGITRLRSLVDEQTIR